MRISPDQGSRSFSNKHILDSLLNWGTKNSNGNNKANIEKSNMKRSSKKGNTKRIKIIIFHSALFMTFLKGQIMISIM